MNAARKQAALANAAEEQGFRVKKTKAGWMVLAKDGSRSVVFHRTPSCHHAHRNAVADLKKIGVQL